MTHLEIPSAARQASFLDALAEFHQEGVLLDLDMTELRRDFPAFVHRIAGYSRGEGLPEGFVPLTDYWLIEEDEFIGRVSIRHSLTEGLQRIGGQIGYQIRPSQRRTGYGTRILALALPKAREMGLTRVLVTCDETNVGSRKIIEANGGEFENAEEVGKGQPRKLRYWIQRMVRICHRHLVYDRVDEVAFVADAIGRRVGNVDSPTSCHGRQVSGSRGSRVRLRHPGDKPADSRARERSNPSRSSPDQPQSA